MRRRGHPSRPRAITCCFFASLKTLLISTKATCLTPKSTSRASFSLAGFQVTLIGRFWVTPEDLDNAIKYHSSGKYHSAYSSTAPIYSLLAKAAMLVKDYQGALTDLETAVNATDDPNEVFNNGGVKPEDNTNASALQKSDLDVLVTTYPDDYRARMYRGLFYGTFTTYDERYYAPEIDNLNQAAQKNPKSALPHYFLGRVFRKMTFWTQTAARDTSDITGARGGYKDKTHEKALEHFEAAVRLEPTFAPGYAEVA